MQYLYDQSTIASEGCDLVLAKKIKTLREEQGMTQTELAKRLNITRSSVNAWEQGISTPSTQFVVELAELFGVSTDYLLGMKKSAVLDVEGLTEDDVFLIYSMVKHLKKLREQGYSN